MEPCKEQVGITLWCGKFIQTMSNNEYAGFIISQPQEHGDLLMKVSEIMLTR